MSQTGLNGHLIKTYASDGTIIWQLDVAFIFHSAQAEPRLPCHRQADGVPISSYPSDPSSSSASGFPSPPFSSSSLNSAAGHTTDFPLPAHRRASPLLPPRRPLPHFPFYEQMMHNFEYHNNADIPCWILRRNTLRVTLGDLPRSYLPKIRQAPLPTQKVPIATTSTSTSSSSSHTFTNAGPFLGDYSAGTWNTQALFARDFNRYIAKRDYAHKLAVRHDAMVWTETHGTLDGNSGWREPPGCKPWWAPWASTEAAGIGITVRETFLEAFDETRTR